MKKTILLSLICFFPGLFAKAELPSDLKAALAVEETIDSIEHPLPIVDPMFDYHIRDVSICKGPGGMYYMTGTTDDNWGIAEGIRVWQSNDLKNWEILGGEDGLVWTFEDDGHPWQKKVGYNKKWNRTYRGIWAPEIHYFKGTFWIPYTCSNVHDSGLLKSVSGNAEGPYVDLKTDGPLVDGIDATLVEDENGDIWYVWAYGRVHKMNEDMSGFEGDEYPALFAEGGGKVGYEGVNIFRHGGKYHLIAAEWNGEGPQNGHEFRDTDTIRRSADSRYDCMIATSDALLGPYSKAYIAAPHAGHNVLFTDHDGKVWATMFGNDEAAAPFREDPAVLPLKYDEKTSRFSPLLQYGLGHEEPEEVVYVAPGGDGDGSSWENASGNLQELIDRSEEGTHLWLKAGEYTPVVISGKTDLTITGGFSGNENSSKERDFSDGFSVFSPKKKGQRSMSVADSYYLRLDGLEFKGADLEGLGYRANGAGLHIVGGGESIRIINSAFKGNRAGANGGAIYLTDGSSPLFVNCLFENNYSRRNGGAVYAEANLPNGYHVRFYNCDFKGNFAQHHGGAAFMRTIHKQTGLLRFINCRIHNNQSLLEKGVIALDGGASLLMSHCDVRRNRAMTNGAVVASLGRPPVQNRIVNSIFAENTGGYLFEGEGFIPGDNHPWTPGRRAWTEFEHNVFSDNNTKAILRRYYDANLWVSAEELDATIIGNGNQSTEEIGTETLIDRGTRSNAFPIDIEGNIRDMTESDLPDIGVIEA